MSSVLIVMLLGVWSSSFWLDDGGSCKCDLMRKYAVDTFDAFASLVKDARTVMVQLAIGLMTLALQMLFAKKILVGDDLRLRRCWTFAASSICALGLCGRSSL